MEHKTTAWNKKIWILLLICLYFAFTYWRCTFININSDFANLVLEAKDLLSGNIFRNGWNLTGISFLTTDLIYYVIGVLFCGVSAQAYWVASALMITFLMITTVLLTKDYLEQENRLAKFFILVIGVFPNFFSVGTLRAHTGVFILSFLDVFLFLKLKDDSDPKQNLGLSVAAAILLAVGIFGDPIILVLFAVPVCLWATMAWIKEQINSRMALKFLGITASGTLLGFLADKAYFAIGSANKNAFLDVRTFVSLDDISRKFSLYLRTLLFMTDGGFEGQSLLSIKTLIYAVNILVICVFMGMVVYNIVRFCKNSSYDFVTVILGTGFLLLSLLFILTNIVIDVAGARYIGFFPALMSIVLIRNLDRWLKLLNPKWSGVFLAFLIVLIIGKGYFISKDKAQGMSAEMDLIHVLEANDLHYGFASFWNASKVTVLSHENIHVRSITGNQGGLRMHNWFCKDDWYRENSNFVIVQAEDRYKVTEETAKTFFGEPSEILECGAVRILVYRKNLSEYLINGFEDGIIMPNEWRRSDQVELKNDVCILKSGGILFGPYDRLEAGKYTAVVYGENINGAKFDVFANSCGKIRETDVMNGENEFTFSFVLEQDVDDLELRIFNHTGKEMTITRMLIFPKVTELPDNDMFFEDKG